MEAFTEHAGTAGLSGRDLCPADVLAADKYLTGLAAGDENRRDHRQHRCLAGARLPAPAVRPARRHPPSTPPPRRRPLRRPRPRRRSRPPTPDSPAIPGPGLRGTVHLTMPLTAWLGWTQLPGEVPGFGPLDACDFPPPGLPARPRPRQPLVRHPHRPRRSPRRPRLRTPPGLRHPQTPPPHLAPAPGTAPVTAAPPARHPVTDHRPLGHPAAHPRTGSRTLTFTTLQTRDCTHDRESRGYQPGRALRHLIEIRNPACTAPGCRRPADRCDLDHVTPYDQGGKTCECNLGPACRHDHHRKQTPGWTLTTPTPGTLTWTTPANRTHTTTPAQYWE